VTLPTLAAVNAVSGVIQPMMPTYSREKCLVFVIYLGLVLVLF
jgi:hypothetical protein